MGGLLCAFLVAGTLTAWWNHEAGLLGEQLRAVAEAKTLDYQAYGAAGCLTALVKGMLANWLVTVGTVLGFSSRPTSGRILAMWLPVMTFLASALSTRS